MIALSVPPTRKKDLPRLPKKEIMAWKVVRNVVVRLPEDVGMTFLGYPVKLVVESKP